MTLHEALNYRLECGRTLAQILLDERYGDGLFELLRLRDAETTPEADKEAIRTALAHPVLTKSMRNALAQASTI
jgi:hypothetical protein